LLDGAILVIGSNHGIAEMEIFDCGLEFAAVILGDLAPKDNAQLVRSSDGAVCIEQTLAQSIESSPATKDEVVTVLGLRKEEPMLTTGLLTFGFRKERSEAGEPLLPASNYVIGQHGV
jgi:hypothetical protein